MATFNTAHHESGGVILFSGELILLFCDNVNVTLPQTSQNETGRLYLTTHRMVFTAKSMKSSLKSFSAPFYSMHDLNLEQPIFGANYIKGKVNDAQTNNAVTFKLKFNSGGAIEYGQALQSAARLTRNAAAQGTFQPPPPYTASASQYYQAPPTVYQPAYNCGFVLPTDIFNQPPPAGFIYTSEAPPPYPGLGPQQPQQTPGGYPPTSQFPQAPQANPNGYPPASGYPGGPTGYGPPGGMAPPAYPSASAPGYPGVPPVTSVYSQPPTIGFATGITGGYPPSQPGFPSAAPGLPYGAPQNQGYPPAYPAANGYPPATGSGPGYPGAGFPGQTYPSLNNDYSNASAPSYYPDKKGQ